MTDFHSHILFKFDDGPRVIEISLDMLRKACTDGVETLVSTSHCYPKNAEDVDVFLDRRTRRMADINAEIAKSPADYPHIVLGSEVHLTGNIAEIENIKKLCIEGTDYMLVELPYEWNNNTADNVYNLTLLGIKPIMAHIERYLGEKPEYLDNLFSLNGLLYQVNAETFIGRDRRTAHRLLETGMCQFIGSDMHNMASRPPQMHDAEAVLLKRGGKEYVEFFDNNAARVFKNEPVDKNAYKRLPKIPARKLLF